MPSDVRQAGRLVFALTLALYLTTTGGSMATDIMSYEVTKGMVDHGTVAMSHNVFNMEAHRGVDGRYYAPYGIGHALYSIPFYASARAVERASGVTLGKSEALPKAGFVMGSAVAAALTVWVAFLFAWRLSVSTQAAAMTALTIGAATLLWPYAKFGFSAPLAALCVMFGTYGTWTGTRFDRPLLLALGGAGLGAALLVKHELALLCLPVGLWILAESRLDWRLIVRRGLLAGLPVAAAVMVTMYYNETRFGNPFDTGYLRDETVALGPLWVGVSGLLLSPGRSVFLYSPVLIAGIAALLALGGRDRRTMMLLGGEFAVMLCFYGSLAHWDAERSYGPRYLLPVVPLLALPLAGWFAATASPSERGAGLSAPRTFAALKGPRYGSLKSASLAALVVLSVLVQLPGILVDFSKVGSSSVVGYPTWNERQWAWRVSGLTINTRASLEAVPANLKNLATGERPLVKPAQDGARDFSDQFRFSLDFWWVYLFYLGAIPAPVAIALGVACLGATFFLAVRLRLACRDQ